MYIPLGVYSLKAVCDATSLQATASVLPLHSLQSIICRICSCLLSLNVAVTVRSSPLFGVSMLDRIVASVSLLALQIHASFINKIMSTLWTMNEGSVVILEILTHSLQLQSMAMLYQFPRQLTITRSRKGASF